ncbi:hypothetical protein MNV49_007602 [Pseudohyphozyma bogoriensis]|nr:hypothetical protein MNV49_007602 [Pseudohyphozyma bogoriensis]
MSAPDAEPAPTTISVELPTSLRGTVPLSLPAILQNPRPRAPPVLAQARKTPKASSSTLKDGGISGKRRMKRHENATFAHNPHAVLRPSSRDLLPTPPRAVPLFMPRPDSFKTSVVLPPIPPSAPSPTSTSNGLFSLSLKGVRKSIRKSLGPNPTDGWIPTFITTVEAELRAWLSATSGLALASVPNAPRKTIIVDPEGVDAVVEISRVAHSLRWEIEDAYCRWLVHCICRWNSITRARPGLGAGDDTPPPTDLSASELSAFEETSASESEWEEVEREFAGTGIIIRREREKLTWEGMPTKRFMEFLLD